MKERNCIVAMISLAALVMVSCAARQPLIHEATPHEHKYPFTQVIGDYHLRLVVDHETGEMFLFFEDITENPVRLVRLESILGQATLPDGTTTEITFRPTKPLSHKFIHKYHGHLRYRLAGTYVAQADWVKANPSFELRVCVPLEGRTYDLTYEYNTPRAP